MKHPPLIPLLAGLVLVVWRPAWTSVATLAILTLASGAWAIWQAQQEVALLCDDMLSLRASLDSNRKEVAERLATVEHKAQRAIDAIDRPMPAKKSGL